MHESNIIKIIVAGTLALITVVSVFWFLRNFELADHEITGGYSTKALHNPFLAAERYLKLLKVPVGSLTYTELWHTKLTDDDVVVFYHYLPPKSLARQQQLRQWIESGGQLIVDADMLPEIRPAKSETENSPDLLASLGVAFKSCEADLDKEDTPHIKIEFSGEEQQVMVSMNPTHCLIDQYDEAATGVKYNNGYALLQYQVKKGWLTVLADTSFLSNHQIGSDDNALALAMLVGTPQHGKVWLVHDITVPSLTQQIWQHASQAVIAITVAVLLWLWSMGTRLGPPLPPAAQPRRDIGEHLAATAHFLWRHDHAKSLMQANRQRVEQSWLNKHYLLRNLSIAERCEWIGARSGLPSEKVQHALYSDHLAESDFIELSSYLQILRTSL